MPVARYTHVVATARTLSGARQERFARARARVARAYRNPPFRGSRPARAGPSGTRRTACARSLPVGGIRLPSATPVPPGAPAGPARPHSPCQGARRGGRAPGVVRR